MLQSLTQNPNNRELICKYKAKFSFIDVKRKTLNLQTNFFLVHSRFTKSHRGITAATFLQYISLFSIDKKLKL